MSKYINPYTDYGFKKLFGTEANKDLLLDFLNQLVTKEHKIADLTFQDKEQLGFAPSDRKAIFDIYCTTESGEKIIIEMQKAKVNFFKDRTIFYSSFPISEQAKKGDWSFELKAVYCIAILDFEFDAKEKRANYKSEVTLKDQECREFYDKLKYVFIEMPKFKKTEEQLESQFEKWLYFLKHLVEFETIPSVLKEPIFEKGFKEAEIAMMSAQEHESYLKSFLTYREITSVEETAFDEGREEGMKEGRQEGIQEGREEGMKEATLIVARQMVKKGFSVQEVSDVTGLSLGDVESLT